MTDGTELSRAGAARRSPVWLGLLLYACVLALPLLAGLGSAPLYDVDEGAFAEATRELLTSGDWGHTTLNGADRFDKPILVYWLQAASAAAFGLTPWALRLPSALCTWLGALALARFVAPRRGLPTAALAGVMAVTAVGPWAMARAATADALLNLLLLLTALDLWRHLEHGARAPLRRAALWVGLGLLAKGPVALLLPGATLGLWALSRRDGAALRRVLGDVPSWAILAAVALPWYAYALQRHGMAFVNGFFLKHNVGRFAGPMEGHGGSLLYYLLVAPLLWLPWSPLWLALAARLRALWADAQTRWLLLWAGFVLTFFSVSGTKLPHYSLYAGPGLTLLTAYMLPVSGARLRTGLWLALVALVALAAGAAWGLQSGRVPIQNPLYHALLTGAAAPTALLASGGALLLALLLLARWRGARFETRLGAGALFTACWLGAAAAPWYGQALQGPVEQAARHAAAAAGPDDRIVQWETHWPSAAFVAGRPTPLRAPQPGELALVRSDRLPRLRAQQPLAVLHDAGGVAVVRALDPAAPAAARQAP